MAEFGYYTPMDRAYHTISEMDKFTPKTQLEKPIIPINQLGVTIPEHDPSNRFRNVVQNVQAQIRRGVGTMQIMLQTGTESAVGGRPKAYGEEVRQALREVVAAN